MYGSVLRITSQEAFCGDRFAGDAADEGLYAALARVLAVEDAVAPVARLLGAGDRHDDRSGGNSAGFCGVVGGLGDGFPLVFFAKLMQALQWGWHLTENYNN